MNKKIEEILSKVKDFVWDKPTDFLYSQYHWVRKSIEYAWFLRNDYDFDYSSTLRLLKYKLSRMRKRIQDDNIIMRTEEVCAQIYHAECLIQNLLDDEFGKESRKAHNEKWDVRYFCKTGPWRQVINAKTSADEAQEEKEWREMMEKSAEERQRCKRELFNHLHDYIEEWWN